MDEILWIKSNPPVRLAIVLRPRGEEWLAREMLRIKNAGIQTLVSLLEPHEAEFLGLAEEEKFAEEAGLRFLNYPIPDTRVPSSTAHFRTFISGLVQRLREGESVGIHCRGCIGRATITAACVLIQMGLKPLDAMAAVEAARGCPVPDNSDQLEWILRYKAKP
jgi:protein-tyrosine phosphatase